MPVFTQLRIVIVACCSALTISACSITAISPEANNPTTPDQWQTSKANLTSVREAWLEDMAEPQLIPLINEALQNNYQLAQQLALLDESRHALTISGADRFPELSLSADGSRRKNSINNLPIIPRILIYRIVK